MAAKALPLPAAALERLADSVGTPFHIYDGPAIERNAEDVRSSFSWNEGFINYFAVKALPNVNIVRLLAHHGFGADCSSLPELIIAHDAGIPGERIMFTSNDTPDEEFRAAYDLGAILNLDDITHIEAVERACGCLPETISFRFNPGPERTGNVIIGNPVEAKYGVTRDQLFDCYRIAKEKGVRRFMLHTMVASNELDGGYIVETARMLFSLVKEIHDRVGVRIERIDLGGGVGIPYRPEDEAISFRWLGEEIHRLYDEMIVAEGLAPLALSFEMGRAITGPYGWLISRVRHVTHKYKDYVGLDATMADLMRPALYGAYHHITAIGKEDLPKDHVYDVTGSLCENNDKFAINRSLPELKRGDLVAIHDTGAHGHSMGFNYNAKLRHAEYLIADGGRILCIRRAETIEDYLSTQLDAPLEVST